MEKRADSNQKTTQQTTQTSAQSPAAGPNGIAVLSPLYNGHLRRRPSFDSDSQSLQRASNDSSPVSEVPAIVQDVLRSPGRPLDSTTRSFMHAYFDHDFSNVKVHTGGQAARSAKAVNALAYASGSHIVFGDGQYEPRTPTGARLLAHELTHTIQQEQAPTIGDLILDHPDSPAEQEAERNARSLVEGTPPSLTGGQPARVARQVDEDKEEQIAEKVSELPTILRIDAGSTNPAAEADPGAPSTPTLTPAVVAAPIPGTPQPDTRSSVQSDAGAVPQPEAGGDRPKADIAASPPTTSASSTPAPGTCPAVFPRRIMTPVCSVNGPVGPELRKQEVAPELPILSDDDFDGDAEIASFAEALARCRAERTVNEEVRKQYQNAVDQAHKDAKVQAKLDKEKAIANAVAKVEPPSGEKGSKARYNSEVARAKRAATAQADQEAKQKEADAVKAIARPDPTVVQAELQAKYYARLVNDFKATLQSVLTEYGPSWQKRALARLKKTRNDKMKILKAKPKVKKGETPPPARTEEEINQDLETFMQEQRCIEVAQIQNMFEGFKRGWAVARREEVDFDTVVQPNVKAMAPGFAPPREVPVNELLDIPIELQGDENMPGVAPEVVGFLRILQFIHPNFKADNYRGHGGGSFRGKGFSLDLYLRDNVPIDDRGFWEHNAAVNFLKSVGIAAILAGAEWRVLYNDFSVAEEVNRAFGVRRVVFMGGVFPTGGINYHGPAPLKLHFHLDISPTVSLPTNRLRF